MMADIERIARFGRDPAWLALADPGKDGKTTLDGAGRIPLASMATTVT